MRTTILLPLLLVFTINGCKKEPNFAGVSLECTADASCQTIEADWRCFQSVCIKNSPPLLEALPTQVVLPGTAVTVQASWTDAESDTVTVSWTAVGALAEALLPSVYDGEMLSVLPQDLGIYEFQVVAADAYSAGAPRSFTLVVQPSNDAIYVARGDCDGINPPPACDADVCGAFDTPCASVTLGLEALSASGASELLLAGASSRQGYVECLDIQTPVTILGCFDTATWERDPELRDLCRITCDDPTGHSVTADATIEQVVLALSPGMDPSPHPDLPGEALPLTTLWIKGSSPALDLVAIEAPACTDLCISLGVGLLNSNATLRGLEVGGTVDDFDPLYVHVSVLIQGGAPVIAQLPAADAPDGIDHAVELRLNAPTLFLSGGVLAQMSAATLDGANIRGGPAELLFGVFAIDGEVTIANTNINLEGFGSDSLVGLSAGSCAGSNDEICDCNLWMTSAECTARVDGSSGSPSVTLRDSRIHLAGTIEEVGSTPCSAVGLFIDGEILDSQIVGNEMTFGHNMTQVIAMGIFSETASTTTHRIDGNTVTVGDGEVDYLCLIESQDPATGEFEAGSSGLLLFGVGDTTVVNNSFTIGASTWGNAGLDLVGVERATVANNSFTVGVSETGIWTPVAAAVGITSTRSPQLSLFERNRVQLGNLQMSSDGLPEGGVVSGTAMNVSMFPDEDAEVTFHPSWAIRNNFISGGEAVYATALSYANLLGDPAQPEFSHNTIVAGSHADFGGISTALQMLSWDPVGSNHDAGRFRYNLLDAGDGAGLKTLIDNEGSPGFFTDSETVGNIGQFARTSEGPRPALAASFTLSSDGSDGTASAVQGWHTLLAGAGIVLSTYEDQDSTGTSLVFPPNAGLAMVGGKPLNDARGRPIGWMGRADGVDTAVIALPHGFAVGRFVDGVGYFTFERAQRPEEDGGPEYLYPCAILVDDFAGSNVSDILFAEGPSCAPAGVTVTGGLWLMRGRRAQEGGGYEAPRLLEAVDVTDPHMLRAGSQDQRYFVVDGTTVLYGDLGTSAAGLQAADLGALGLTEVLDLLPAAVNPRPAAGPATEDVVLLADDGVHIWLDIARPADMLVVDSEATVPDVPCSATTSPSRPTDATPIAIAVGNLAASAGNKNQEVVVACDDGYVDLFTFASLAADDFNRLIGLNASPDTISFVAVGTQTGAANTQQGHLLVLRSGLGIHRLESWPFDPNTGFATGTGLGFSLNAIADTAMYDPSQEADFTRSGFTRKLSTQNPCQLALREVGGAPYDLALVEPTAETNDCIDLAAASPAADDIDGCGSRTDGSPDVGADEFGEVGNACND